MAVNGEYSGLTDAQIAGIIGGVLAASAVAGVVIYEFVVKPQQKTTTSSSSSGIATINLSVASPTVTEGNSDTFTAVAYNSNNQPVPNATITLTDLTTNQVVSTATTDSTGTATFNVSFPTTMTPGQYTFVASG
ncbi:MAG: SpaA isopeptide-forming pilin-related protein [Candidatus Micrarchaeaceae archaeon]